MIVTDDLAVDTVHVPGPAGRSAGVNPELYEAASLDGAVGGAPA